LPDKCRRVGVPGGRKRNKQQGPPWSTKKGKKIPKKEICGKGGGEKKIGSPLDTEVWNVEREETFGLWRTELSGPEDPSKKKKGKAVSPVWTVPDKRRAKKGGQGAKTRVFAFARKKKKKGKKVGGGGRTSRQAGK